MFLFAKPVVWSSSDNFVADFLRHERWDPGALDQFRIYRKPVDSIATGRTASAASWQAGLTLRVQALVMLVTSPDNHKQMCHEKNTSSQTRP